LRLYKLNAVQQIIHRKMFTCKWGRKTCHYTHLHEKCGGAINRLTMKFFKITNKIYYNPDHHSQPKTLLLQKLKRHSNYYIFHYRKSQLLFARIYKIKRYYKGGRIWPLQDQSYFVQREELLCRAFKEVSLLDNNHYSLSVEDNSWVWPIEYIYKTTKILYCCWKICN